MSARVALRSGLLSAMMAYYKGKCGKFRARLVWLIGICYTVLTPGIGDSFALAPMLAFISARRPWL